MTTIHAVKDDRDGRDLVAMLRDGINRRFAARGILENVDAMEQRLELTAIEEAQAMGCTLEVLPADWILRTGAVPPYFYPVGVSR